MSISIAGVTKRFDNFTALDRVSLDVPGGSLLALLGPSGSGKTTLLRVIAGLEAPDDGTVRCHEEDVTFQAARERNMGFVFQHYALFRHMNVFENIAFGLRVRKVAQPEIEKRVRELLHLVRLEALERRYPNQLSGGQRQRVALARALAVRPRVLLLDEPFGALDAKVRIELRQWLRELHDQTHLTSVFVTHDQEEAFAVADQVVVMNQGRVEQIGTPQEIFEHPANPFVMDFLGNVNVFPGRVQNGRALLGGLDVEYPEHPHDHALPATGYVRPHELDLHEAPNGAPSVAGVVARIQRTGPVVRVLVESTEFGVGLNVELSPERFAELKLAAGDRVYVSPRRVRVFVPEYAI